MTKNINFPLFLEKSVVPRGVQQFLHLVLSIGVYGEGRKLKLRWMHRYTHHAIRVVAQLASMVATVFFLAFAITYLRMHLKQCRWGGWCSSELHGSTPCIPRLFTCVSNVPATASDVHCQFICCYVSPLSASLKVHGTFQPATVLFISPPSGLDISSGLLQNRGKVFHAG